MGRLLPKRGMGAAKNHLNNFPGEMHIGEPLFRLRTTNLLFRTEDDAIALSASRRSSPLLPDLAYSVTLLTIQERCADVFGVPVTAEEEDGSGGVAVGEGWGGEECDFVGDSGGGEGVGVDDSEG